MTGRVNIHATVLVADGRGLLIEGPSGAGKSALAFRLVEHLRLAGRFSVLVADDRVWLSAAHRRLVAEVPDAIAGLIELRGLGLVRQPCERRTVVDRVVRLVAPERAARLPEAADWTLDGVTLPRLDVARGDTASAVRAVAAWLSDGWSG